MTQPQSSQSEPSPLEPARPRIALFGGSFDPPHRGHLAIARAAAQAFGLSEVLFTPTGRQPLKPSGAHAPYPDRLHMVALACAITAPAPSPEPLPTPPAQPPRQTPPTTSQTPHPARFTPSTLDAPRPDGRPNYTVDTLAELARQHPTAELFAIAGADSFLDLPRWHQAHRLFDLAQWIVVSRPNIHLDNIDNLGLTPQQRARIHLLETVHDPVSASHLRTRLAAGNPCLGLLPPAVARYIQQHHLYRPTTQQHPEH